MQAEEEPIPQNKLFAPPPPGDISRINLENKLHLPDIRPQEDRPWFLYDIVQPLAMFRRMPPNYDWPISKANGIVDVCEGNIEDLTDNPTGDCLPVAILGYA